MKKIKVLVIGANGFLGSHLVDSLIHRGYQVRAFDRYKDIKDVNFDLSDEIEVFSGDFLNQTDIKTALQDVEYVYHLVSTTTPASADADPLIDIDTNIRGTVELLQRCVAQGDIRRVLYSSSGGTVYGDFVSDTPIPEATATNPVSPYGIGKVAIENYLSYFNRKYQLDYTIFRIANPYGERQPLLRKQGVIPIFADLILKGKPITVYGDGSMVRDYIYVKDVAEIMADALQNEALKNETINLGSGTGESINQIITELEKIIGQTAIIEYKEKPSTFVQSVVLDTQKLIGNMKRVQLTPLDKGISQLVTYMRQAMKQAK